MPYYASPDILQLQDNADVAWKAIELVWDAAPYKSKELAAFMAELTQEQSAFYALDYVQKDILNGGYRQLFENPTGNLVPWALKGIEMLGTKPYADNLREAMSTLGDEYPPSAAARKRALRELDRSTRDRLEELSDEFIDLTYEPATDLQEIRGSYIRAHPEGFVEP